MKPPPTAPEMPLTSPSEVDPGLLSLPAPPRRERTLSVVLMAITALASIAMTLALRSEVRYALAPGSPVDLGDLTASPPSSPELENAFVRASGLLGSAGAMRYERPLEGDSFRLAPIAGNPRVWVEMRVPEGAEGPRFVPPTTFAGRLVPMRSAGLRHRGLARSVRDVTGAEVPEEAWLLVDGAAPASSRWAVPLVALFAIFALYNLASIARIVRPLRS
jgi:hypothetical protein